MKKNILIVEDSEESLILIKKALHEDYLLTTATSVQEFKNLSMNQSFDFFILDIILPDGTGFDICEKIRTNPLWNGVQILFLSSLNDEKDKIKGFDLGADDYLTKPFSMNELRARVKARLRSAHSMEEHFENFGQIIVQSKSHRVYTNSVNVESEVLLTNKEYKLLMLLCHSPEQVFSRDQLLNHVWPELTHVLPRTVDTHLSKLRKKLKTAGHQIEAIHGVGYRFVLKSNEK